MSVVRWGRGADEETGKGEKGGGRGRQEVGRRDWGGMKEERRGGKPADVGRVKEEGRMGEGWKK